MAVKRVKRGKKSGQSSHSPDAKDRRFRTGDIEVVSFDEVYLWGRRETSTGTKSRYTSRVKRICGKYLGRTKGTCTQIAGNRTSHFGVGYCKKHRGTDFQEHVFRIEYLRLRATLELDDIMAGAEVSDDEMASLKSEVALLSSILKITLAKYPDSVITEQADQNLAVKIVGEITRIKKTYAEIRGMKLSISPRQIEMFVERILSIVKSVAGEDAVLEIERRFGEITLSFGKGASLPAVQYKEE